jgi:predicted metal-dependent phosphoesterase TrpH
MRKYRADLHLHTVLSACAEVEMIPPLIVETAKLKGIDIIAVTDHNASGNVLAVMEAAAVQSDLCVFPGMELQVKEEIDVLCIFDTFAQLADWQNMVDAWLPLLKNDSQRFGPQFVVDAEGTFIAEDNRLLQAPTTIGLEEAALLVHELGGLVIPAHIDRWGGLMKVLGLWPPDLQADAAEVSPNMHPEQAYELYNLPDAITVVSHSDAHWLDWIGKVVTVYELNEPPSVTALRNALLQREGCSAYVP